MADNVITPEEAKFCLLYVNAPAPMSGDPRRCYKAVYGSSIDDAEAQARALELMSQEHIKARLDELIAKNTFDTVSLKHKLTATLLKITDECADCKTIDRFGHEVSPAPLRAVAVNAVKTLNDMYGIKEDIAHKVTLEGGDGNGIVFNINVPTQTNKEEEEFND